MGGGGGGKGGVDARLGCTEGAEEGSLGDLEMH